MTQHINRGALCRLVQSEKIEALSFSELVALFRDEIGGQGFLPDGMCQTDPRSNDRVLFNTSRARRPQDNRPVLSDDSEMAPACAVCQGRTTGIVDVAPLSSGSTFINKNLYPSLYPLGAELRDKSMEQERLDTRIEQTPWGLHFLQWTSSFHDRDWHNMPLVDRVVVMQRLAALERGLLTQANDDVSGADSGWTVLIIKNCGRLVGGSLAHGHQQIALSNVLPRRMQDDERFEQERGERFTAFLMRENPTDLIVRDYGPALLLVPYFMRRPFDMMLLIKDVTKQQLHDLNLPEITAVAEGWHDALRAIRWIMPRIGKEIAYNIVTHNGPGAGLYFEFLPYTQEMGGFEHLGLFVCQGSPGDAANRLRAYLDD
jgi:galactose-1-phosphate uridylyltransferase